MSQNKKQITKIRLCIDLKPLEDKKKVAAI